jgi:hypothetical protein
MKIKATILILSIVSISAMAQEPIFYNSKGQTYQEYPNAHVIITTPDDNYNYQNSNSNRRNNVKQNRQINGNVTIYTDGQRGVYNTYNNYQQPQPIYNYQYQQIPQPYPYVNQGYQYAPTPYPIYPPTQVVPNYPVQPIYNYQNSSTNRDSVWPWVVMGGLGTAIIYEATRPRYNYNYNYNHYHHRRPYRR